MQSWDGLRLGMLAHGYRLAKFFQIACVSDGEFRMAVEAECEFYLCPKCQLACKAVFLCEGYTKKDLPFSESVDQPLQFKYRRLLFGKEEVFKRRAVSA